MILPLKPRFYGPVHCVVRSSSRLRQESTLFAMMSSLLNNPPNPPFLANLTDVQSRSADRQNEGAGTEGPAGPLEPCFLPHLPLGAGTIVRYLLLLTLLLIGTNLKLVSSFASVRLLQT
jgi:hypothetical protein